MCNIIIFIRKSPFSSLPECKLQERWVLHIQRTLYIHNMHIFYIFIRKSLFLSLPECKLQERWVLRIPRPTTRYQPACTGCHCPDTRMGHPSHPINKILKK